MNSDEIKQYLLDIPDEVMENLAFSVPWQSSELGNSYDQVDEDGFSLISTGNKEDTGVQRSQLQQICWQKFQTSPQVNTAIRGLTGRLVGSGFKITCPVAEVQDAIDEIQLDWRNQLYKFWAKFVSRSLIEGELFLLFTVHKDGFIEIDFIDPSVVSNGGDDGTGIIFHPTKALLPVFYNLRYDNLPLNSKTTKEFYEQVPSIYVAKFPELARAVKDHVDFNETYQKKSKSRNPAFSKIGGYYRFICAWEKGFMTKRAVGYLRTTIAWLNHYENLKKYEIDHKKSSGAYVWAFKITEPRMFKLWLSLTDEERAKTGIMAKKTPGASVVLPPGVEMEAKFPQLTKLSGEDTDILNLVTSGLNEPEDVSTGKSSGTYASIKASRGPASDRVMDEIAYFERWLQYDFWAAIFYLKSAVSDFPSEFEVKEATGFKDKKPVFRTVKKPPERLLEIDFPTSEMIDFESRAKGLLGVKHGPISQALGISNKEVARRMGFNSYSRSRLDKALEDDQYPELVYDVDSEKVQETAEGEPPKTASTTQRPKLAKRTSQEEK